MSSLSRAVALMAALAMLSVLFAGCPGDDDDDGSETPGAETPSPLPPEDSPTQLEPTTPPDTSPTPEEGSSDSHGLGEAWGETSRVSRTGDYSGGGVGRKLVVDSSGVIHIVWTELSGSSYDIFYARSVDGGLSWSEGRDITQSPLPATSPNLALGPDDTLHLAWTDRREGGQPRLFYGRSFNGGDDWEEGQDLSGSSEQAVAAPSISVDTRNRVHIAWHLGDTEVADPPARVFYIRSPNGGDDFDDVQPLNTGVGHAAWPRFSVEGTTGDLVVIPWRDNRRAPDWDVFLAVSTDGGENFLERPGRVTDDRDWDPDAVIDALGRVHLTWTVFSDDGPPSVQYARSPDQAKSLTGVRTVSEGRSELSSWAPDPARGIFWLWWKDERDADSSGQGDEIRADVACRYTADGGDHWSDLEFATDEGDLEVYFPSLAAGPDGQVHVMWNDLRDGEEQSVVFVRSRTAVAR